MTFPFCFSEQIFFSANPLMTAKVPIGVVDNARWDLAIVSFPGAPPLDFTSARLRIKMSSSIFSERFVRSMRIF